MNGSLRAVLTRRGLVERLQLRSLYRLLAQCCGTRDGHGHRLVSVLTAPVDGACLRGNHFHIHLHTGHEWLLAHGGRGEIGLSLRIYIALEACVWLRGTTSKDGRHSREEALAHYRLVSSSEPQLVHAGHLLAQVDCADGSCLLLIVRVIQVTDASGRVQLFLSSVDLGCHH